MVSMAASPSMTMASKPFVAFKAHLAPPDLPSSSSSSSSTTCPPSSFAAARILSSSSTLTICKVLTSGPSHGIDVTREAIQEGVDDVIAVGGDGNLHQVVNGFLCNGQPLSCQDEDAIRTTAFGLIPLGTGSDFARSFDWKNNLHEVIDRIAKAYNTFQW